MTRWVFSDCVRRLAIGPAASASGRISNVSQKLRMPVICRNSRIATSRILWVMLHAPP
jgi:hypothetical protein